LTVQGFGGFDVGLESASTVKLVTIGRRTGLPHIVVTRFVNYGGSLYALPGKTKSDWALNALAAGSVKVRIGEMVCLASASRASLEEASGVLELFRTKYGSGLVNRWYSRAGVCIRLEQTTTPTRRGTSSGEGQTTTSLPEWRKKNENYYLRVAEAFDSASEEYDFTIRSNFINSWIRNRSLSELLAITREDDTLLEIGCGTGSEAIRVSKKVSRVVATDISSGMISLLQRKIDALGLLTKITAVRLGATEIAAASSELPRGSARVAYSLNGALNCEPELRRVPGELSRVVKSGGYFVCSIRNSLCLPEALVHGAAFQFGRMAPRKKQPVMVSVGGMDIPSYYYRPQEFARYFSSHFEVKRMLGLPAILPPAYLSDLYFRARRVLSFSERMESALAGSFPFNRFGDQTLFIFRRK